MKTEKDPIAKKKSYGIIKQNISGWSLLLPTIFLLIFVVLKPLFMGIINSFYDLKGFTPDKFVGFENFCKISMHQATDFCKFAFSLFLGKDL